MLFVGCSLIFTGCPIFLSGADLKEEIEQTIDIAAAKEMSIEVNSIFGSITPAGIIKAKKIVPFEIEFSVKNGSLFEGHFDVFEKAGGKNKNYRKRSLSAH